MTQKMTEELLTHVESTENSLHNDNIEEWFRKGDGQVIEVSADITLRGRLREITLLVTTGGPHIEVDLYSNYVRGNWGSESVSVPIDQTEQYEQIRSYWKDRVIRNFDLE